LSVAGGFALGLIIAMIATPVGVSGAVFLLPAQLSLLNVPSPAVTPTNLLFNVVAVPGALARYRRQHGDGSRLARHLLVGTVPGVVIGAVIRVFLVPGGTVFRVLIAVFLLPLGIWLFAKPNPTEPTSHVLLGDRSISALALGAGLIGGIYGIGGGSLLAPILVAAGYAVAEVAPAALLSTFVTSCVGALAYTVLDLTGQAHAAPHWVLGIACGLGGLVGGYIGAGLQSRLPRDALRRALGVLAAALAVAYLVQAIRT
jgi:uncharacterized membrane protein YfcA